MEILIDKTYYNPLSKLFNYAFFQKVHKKEDISKELNLLNSSGILNYFNNTPTYKDIIVFLYNQFKEAYRCEYIYKNEIIKIIYNSKKELFDDIYVLNEFRVNFSKADFLIVNGHVTIYEIKTDLDSLSRLKGQIEDYQKIAQYINIVTSPKFVNNLSDFLPDNIGILVFNENNTIEIFREATLNCNMDLDTIFSSLNNTEHRRVIEERYILVPQVPNTQFYDTYLELFKEMGSENAYSLFIKQLKKRRNNTFNPITHIPEELLGIALNQKNNFSLNNFFEICELRLSL